MDSVEFSNFYNMPPMKYYQPASYGLPAAKAMLENEGDKCIATMKNDGEWCRIIVGNGNCVAQSRSISKVTGEYGNKTEHIPHIMEEVAQAGDVVLLGELCYRDITKTSKDVGSILRCLPANALSRQKLPENRLNFVVFDCLYADGESLMGHNYENRFAKAQEVVNRIGGEYVRMCEFTTHDFEEFLQEILAKGGEGIVIHTKRYLYAPGKRTAWTTMKVKKITQELELPVVAAIKPNKLYGGTELESWGYWIVENEVDVAVTKPYYFGWENGVVVNHEGTEVRVTSGLTDDDRAWLATEEAKTAIENGQLYAVVSAMEVDKVSGSLRHPRLIRLRTDCGV